MREHRCVVEQHIRFLVRQDYQLLIGDVERVHGWPANFYCLEHLLLEISAEHISDACTPSFVTLLQKMSGKTRGFGPNI